MRAVGITDHGTIAGVVAFLQECRKHGDDIPEKHRDQYPDGIKPILGAEMYLSRNHQCHDREGQPDAKRGNRHLNVIAKNWQGFQNLCALSHEAYVNGYYYDPRIDFELLNKYREGLIVTSACLSNIVNKLLLCDQYEKARLAVGHFKDVFADDFYLEMMYHGLDDEATVLPLIQKLGKETNTKVIASNDSHYVEKSDAEFQQVLMCMSTGRSIKDPKRLRFPYDEFYFKSADEMYKIFRSIPSVVLNTLEIAEKCDYSDIVFGKMKLPHFTIPESCTSPHDYLTKLAYNGLKRLNLDKSEVYQQRLKMELDDLKLSWDTKGYDFATYFLIVEDVMSHARKNKISAGVRGSAAGSLLLYCLGASEEVDPIKYGLLWSRFMGFSDSRFLCRADFGIKKRRMAC